VTLLLTFTRSAWLGWLAAVFVSDAGDEDAMGRLRDFPVLIAGIALLPLSLFQPCGLFIRHAAIVRTRSIRMVQAGSK